MCQICTEFYAHIHGVRGHCPLADVPLGLPYKPFWGIEFGLGRPHDGPRGPARTVHCQQMFHPERQLYAEIPERALSREAIMARLGHVARAAQELAHIVLLWDSERTMWWSWNGEKFVSEERPARCTVCGIRKVGKFLYRAMLCIECSDLTSRAKDAGLPGLKLVCLQRVVRGDLSDISIELRVPDKPENGERLRVYLRCFGEDAAYYAAESVSQARRFVEEVLTWHKRHSQ